jgi:hypothetical protein
MTDDELWRAFSDRTLPHADWNHRAHLRVAFLHLERWSVDEAHLRMRAGILRLNAAHGLEETPARGYHETLTYLWLVSAAAARQAESNRSADSNAFCDAHPALLDREHPLRFYSRERLFSLRARALFVEPDREKLPR